ncbi:uncharacterized protein LOC131145756 [Malania oleifera]|uniref:uncharacterized protein LOC131145756 n=1 Tax=Malania oleifera TaxID=397392 RepID=UPI0025AE0D2F|nr:uncharacterized protein LOC131145756 [Malania oleifera]
MRREQRWIWERRLAASRKTAALGVLEISVLQVQRAAAPERKRGFSAAVSESSLERRQHRRGFLLRVFAAPEPRETLHHLPPQLAASSSQQQEASQPSEHLQDREASAVARESEAAREKKPAGGGAALGTTIGDAKEVQGLQACQGGELGQEKKMRRERRWIWERRLAASRKTAALGVLEISVLQVQRAATPERKRGFSAAVSESSLERRQHRRGFLLRVFAAPEPRETLHHLPPQLAASSSQQQEASQPSEHLQDREASAVARESEAAREKKPAGGGAALGTTIGDAKEVQGLQACQGGELGQEKKMRRERRWIWERRLAASRKTAALGVLEISVLQVQRAATPERKRGFSAAVSESSLERRQHRRGFLLRVFAAPEPRETLHHLPPQLAASSSQQQEASQPSEHLQDREASAVARESEAAREKKPAGGGAALGTTIGDAKEVQGLQACQGGELGQEKKMRRERRWIWERRLAASRKTAALGVLEISVLQVQRAAAPERKRGFSAAVSESSLERRQHRRGFLLRVFAAPELRETLHHLPPQLAASSSQQQEASQPSEHLQDREASAVARESEAAREKKPAGGGAALGTTIGDAKEVQGLQACQGGEFRGQEKKMRRERRWIWERRLAASRKTAALGVLEISVLQVQRAAAPEHKRGFSAAVSESSLERRQHRRGFLLRVFAAPEPRETLHHLPPQLAASSSQQQEASQPSEHLQDREASAVARESEAAREKKPAGGGAALGISNLQ